MPISLPRGAAAIGRAGIVLCDAIDRHPLVPATDPDTTRQALYAAVKAACAALRELIPDRFVDPGQSSTATTLTDSSGVDTPTRYRKNGGRLTFRIERAGVVSFASIGVTPFDATTGAFVDGSGTYTTLPAYHHDLCEAIAALYEVTTGVTLERIEQTVGGNLTVATPAGSYGGFSGPGLVTQLPLWVVTTITVRTGQAGRELKLKLPGAGFALGKSTVLPSSSGSAMQKIVALMQTAGGGAEAYNGLKATGVGLISVADSAREYRRLTR